MLKNLNENEFKKEVIESSRLVLVDFYATWCPPCKMLTPILEKISNSRNSFDIFKVNIDDNYELAKEYKVEVVPTMLIFKDGKAVNRMVGLVNENEIIEMMSNYSN